MEFSTPKTIEVREAKQVAVDKARVDAFAVDRLRSQILVEVSFGSGTPFKAQDRELWLITGDFYDFIINATPNGDTLGERLNNGSVSLIKLVQETEGRRDQLIASGELKVSNGDIYGFIGK